jgi:molybdate transport system substrate-binding protein
MSMISKVKASRRQGLRAVGALALLTCAWVARAADVQVAVAANFAAPVARIAEAFNRQTGHHAVVVIGSTGQLYAQIKNGAPFEILLAADAATPKRLEDEALAVAGQRFTYATGKLVLYSARPGFVDGQGEVLRNGNFAHLALANPATAPYGAAGQQALRALGLLEAVRPRIVQGESIGQTFEFVVSGNAELGFVALSQAAPPSRPQTGSMWLVPQELYAPILQDAVLLKPGEGHEAALAFLRFLRSDPARAIIRAYGYGV